MSKLLFFDTERANNYNDSMCSFGYVLTDEHFNILEEDDMFMNPGGSWDSRILKDILFYPKEHYKSFQKFNFYYERIKQLFQDDVIVLGHAINNDVNTLNLVCEKYNLPYINFKYYESTLIYKEYTGEHNRNQKSLDTISKELDLERQTVKHTSLQDAQLVMKQVKEMCEHLEINILDLIKILEHCNGENKAGVMIVNYGKKNIGNNNQMIGRNNEFFSQVIKRISIKHINKNRFTNKIVCVNMDYESTNFKEMLLIVKLLADSGAYYNRKASLSNIYVRSDGDIDTRRKYVDRAIGSGKKIEIISMENFLKEIGFKKEDVEENFKQLFMKSKRSENKPKNKSISTTFGDLLNKELIEYKK